MKLLFSNPSNRSRNSPRTRNHEGISSLARLKTGTRGGAERGAAGCVTGVGVCVACGADVASGGTGICADAAVAVAMTTAMSGTARRKPTPALREQITLTLPCTDSVNHKGGDVAGPDEGV